MTDDPLGSFRGQLVQGVRGEPRRRRRRLAIVSGLGAALVIAAGAVAVSAGDSGDQQVTASDPPTTVPFECPVTRPPEPGLTPPEGWPDRPGTGGVWYGTADLWTVLPAGGSSPYPRKSVWWSEHFDVREDDTPEIAVTWRRLDEPGLAPVLADAPGTNAHIPQDGWFMMNGIDPPKLGCWEVTAAYKGYELGYVYEVLPKLWVSPTDGGEQALIQGEVRYDEAGNCYFIGAAPVVWPPGTTVSDDGQIITLVDNTRIGIGDHVRGAGGFGGEAAVVTYGIPPECVPTPVNIAFLNLTQPVEVTP